MSRSLKRSKFSMAVQLCAALLVYIAFITFVVIRVSTNNFNISIIFEYKAMLIEGMKNTLIISSCSLVLGMILGFILYVMQKALYTLLKA